MFILGVHTQKKGTRTSPNTSHLSNTYSFMYKVEKACAIHFGREHSRDYSRKFSQCLSKFFFTTNLTRHNLGSIQEHQSRTPLNKGLTRPAIWEHWTVLSSVKQILPTSQTEQYQSPLLSHTTDKIQNLGEYLEHGHGSIFSQMSNTYFSHPLQRPQQIHSLRDYRIARTRNFSQNLPLERH